MLKLTIGKVYFAKQNPKVMMLSNGNIQIGILEINREGKITFLNKMPYLPDSRNLVGRNVYTAVELFEIEWRFEPPISLGTTKTLE